MTFPGPFCLPVQLHGGPDAAGIPVFDFSTNSNACGPCPEALRALQSADATRYPDPAYTALREVLGAFHGVVPGRIVLAGGPPQVMQGRNILEGEVITFWRDEQRLECMPRARLVVYSEDFGDADDFFKPGAK